MLIRSWLLCNRVMCQSHMPIQVHWKQTLVSNRVQAFERDSENLQSGIKNSIRYKVLCYE